MRGLLLDQRAQPVRNLVPRPRPDGIATPYWAARWYGGAGSGAAGTGTSTISTAGAVGGRAFYRKTWATSPGNGPEDTGIQVNRIPVLPNRTYTMLIRVRSSIAQSIRGSGNQQIRVFGFATVGGTGVGVAPVAGDTRIPAGQWVTLRAVFTTPADVYWLAAFPYINAIPQGATNWSPGDTLDMGDAMVVEGIYAGEYCDGDTPGWKWQNGVNSESVGWPYTLESVAGKPLGFLTVAGQSLDTGVVGKSLDPLTLYAVSDKLAAQTNWTDVVAIGPTSGTGNLNGDGVAMTWQGGTGTGVNLRLDTSNTNGQGFNQVAAVGPVSMGRHLWTAVIGGAITTELLLIDNATSSSRPAIPQAGISRRYMWMAPNLTTAAHQCFLAYSAEHGSATRTAVARWLANRYGLALAA